MKNLASIITVAALSVACTSATLAPAGAGVVRRVEPLGATQQLVLDYLVDEAEDYPDVPFYNLDSRLPTADLVARGWITVGPSPQVQTVQVRITNKFRSKYLTEQPPTVDAWNFGGVYVIEHPDATIWDVIEANPYVRPEATAP
jgi:hypothetical protein